MADEPKVILPKRFVDEMIQALMNARTEISFAQMNNFLLEVQKNIQPYTEGSDGAGRP